MTSNAKVFAILIILFSFGYLLKEVTLPYSDGAAVFTLLGMVASIYIVCQTN